MGYVTNSVDPDQTPQNAASDLGLHCLLNKFGKEGSFRSKTANK